MKDLYLFRKRYKPNTLRFTRHIPWYPHIFDGAEWLEQLAKLIISDLPIQVTHVDLSALLRSTAAIFLLPWIGDLRNEREITLKSFPVELGCCSRLLCAFKLNVAEPAMRVVLERGKANIDDVAVLDNHC